MRKFKVQLFLPDSNVPKIKRGVFVELEPGKQAAEGYRLVDVFYKSKRVGEVKKRGIDEIIEKGALVSAQYIGKSGGIPKLTLTVLEPEEYREKPEYKEWASLEDRLLCSDGCCIGLIGPEGKCEVCGKPYKPDTP
jgi:hypothetical protein